MEIITRGAEVFSRLTDGNIGAEKLQKKLCRHHHCDRENVVTLLHPTVKSLLSLDIVFNSLKWSVNAKDIDFYLKSMKKSFMLYCLSDVIELLKPDINIKSSDILKKDAEIGSLNEKDEFEQIVEEQYFQQIETILHNACFFNRIKRIAGVFINAIQYQLAIGFTPVIRSTQFDTPLQWKCLKNLKGKNEHVVDLYCWMYEQSIGKLQVMPLNEVINDLLVTEKLGKKTVSSLKTDRKVEVIDFANEFNLLSCLFGGDLSHVSMLVADELKLLCGQKESKAFFLDRIVRNVMVVSTEVSKNTSDIIGVVMKNDIHTEEDMKLATKKREEDQKRYEKLLQSRLDSLNPFKKKQWIFIKTHRIGRIQKFRKRT